MICWSHRGEITGSPARFDPPCETVLARTSRALRQLRRENTESRYVFVTERGGPATAAGFLKTIARTGEAAKLPFPVHPHMLRHSTGYKLANDGHDTRALQHYMGHKNIVRLATTEKARSSLSASLTAKCELRQALGTAKRCFCAIRCSRCATSRGVYTSPASRAGTTNGTRRSRSMTPTGPATNSLMTDVSNR